MRLLALASIVVPLLAAGALAQDRTDIRSPALQQALAEEAAANAEAAKLERVAASATNEAERLQAEQAAASQAVDAAEAKISAADLQLRLARTFVAEHRQRLAAEQQPVSLLLGGLATMARRPPLLALADRGGTDELVKVRLLLDATVPLIRKRTSSLSAQLRSGEQLEKAASVQRAELASGRTELQARLSRYAALEHRALERATALGGQALGVSDVAMAANEAVDRVRERAVGSQSIRNLAEVLAREQPAPRSPFPQDGPSPALPFVYELPASAPVEAGLGAVSESGVLSRGLTLATSRGTPIVAPADGVVRYAGPYRDYDGVLIIDHGRGWLSLIVNAASTLNPGDRVQRGDEIGRALGPLQVELSRNDTRISPALIAGSSRTLSKISKAS